MKYIVILVLLASCSNKKAAVIGQIKAYQDSINVVVNERHALSLTTDHDTLMNNLSVAADLQARESSYKLKILELKFQMEAE